MKTEMKLTGVDGVIDTLRSLPAEVVSKRGGIALAALRKAAKIILNAEKANLQAILNNATEAEKRNQTGLLMKNVVVTRGKPPFDGKGERVLVRIKRRTYPKKSGGKSVTTLKTANLLEYGSSTQPAQPWIRTAFNANARAAIFVAEVELLKGIDRVVKKLAK